MNRYYAKQDPESGVWEVALANNSGSNIESLLSDGFIAVEETEKPTAPLGEYEAYRVNYELQGDRVVKSYTIESNNPRLIRARIEELTLFLEASDYQIIKCYEAQLVGKPIPYDIAALHSFREALRGRIRELNASIN